MIAAVTLCACFPATAFENEAAAGAGRRQGKWMTRMISGLQRRLSRLEGRMPNAALEELNERELWALQRDLMDAAMEEASPPSEVMGRIRTWARSFQIGGADDLPAQALWVHVRPLVDRQAGGMELDWFSPRMLAILPDEI